MMRMMMMKLIQNSDGISQKRKPFFCHSFSVFAAGRLCVGKNLFMTGTNLKNDCIRIRLFDGIRVMYEAVGGKSSED
jgi:hypothetical protein